MKNKNKLSIMKSYFLKHFSEIELELRKNKYEISRLAERQKELKVIKYHIYKLMYENKENLKESKE